MDDIEELAEALGEDVEELYRKIRDDVMHEVNTEMALSNMLHAIHLLYHRNRDYLGYVLDLIEDPAKSIRMVARENGTTKPTVRKAVKVAEGIIPGFADALKAARVLPEGVGGERGGACKVNTYTNSDIGDL